MFEFLLKYSPVVYSEGEILFRWLPSLPVLIGVVVAVVVILWLVYRKTTLALNRVLKVVLMALKVLAILLLCLMVFEPVISVSTVVPQKSSVLILADDSRSMSIRDAAQNRSRGDIVARLLATQTEGFLADLQNNFRLHIYKFNADVALMSGPEDLGARGPKTDLGRSLNFAAEMAEHGDVSGIILLTDGVDNGGDDPLEAAALLGSRNVPVYTVGVGSRILEDIELAKVAANHSVVENAVVQVSALIKSGDARERTVELELREGNNILKRQTVALSGTATRAVVRFSPQKQGIARYTLTVPPGANEVITQNNTRTFLIDNRNRRARILYVEGYPRAEFKYLRRAVDGDPNIELVSLLRTGPEKFYRQGIQNRNELKDGYPKTRRDLFRYQAVIFGSMEADFFSPEELENTVAFVSERGGGFLMIGGSQAFSQGGYQHTPIARMLPVQLPQQEYQVRQWSATFRDRFKLMLTPQGWQHPVLQLLPSEAENRRLWERLPELEGYNTLGRAKPGATVLAVHPLSEIDNAKIILALQRFGKGRSMAFAASSSWLWQMSMPHTDMSHERFWRQVLRWLALSAPEPIELTLDKETYVPNEQVTLEADVRDSTYAPIEDATIRARITTPSGEVKEVSFQWSSNGKVAYVAAYHPEEQGLYRVDMSVYDQQGNFLGDAESAFFVEKSRLEFTNAHLQEPLLKRIAEITGGRYYHELEATRLPEEIATRESTYSKRVQYDLWDTPALFLLVIVILATEWYLRRNHGLS